MVEGEDAAALRPRFFERMSEQDLREISHDEDDLEFLRGIGVTSAITVALQARAPGQGRPHPRRGLVGPPLPRR